MVNITTGGGHGMSLEERLAAALRAKPEMASLNIGSMNFGHFRRRQAEAMVNTIGSSPIWR